jgi:long-chain acyl-CoA synthetase
MCRNRPEFAEVWAACSRGGYRLTPINWHLTGEEAGYIIDDCEARVIVADARHAQSAADAARRAPLATVRLAIGGDIEGYESYEAALAAEDGANIDDPVPGGQMLYTSGTTGRPKGVTRDMADSPRRTLARPRPGPSPALGSPRSTATHPARTYASAGPLYRGAGAFSLSLPPASGVEHRADGRPGRRRCGSSRHDITHTHMVPTMFVRCSSCPTTCATATTSRHCATSCTVPHRVHPT